MKVKELIEILQKLDPERIVLVKGYEAGYNDIDSVEPITVIDDYYVEWYYGKYENVEHVNLVSEDINLLEGYLLS